MIGVEFDHLDGPTGALEARRESRRGRDWDDIVVHTVQQSEWTSGPSGETVRHVRAGDGVPGGECACETDGVADPKAEARGLHGQSRSGEASHRPADQNQAVGIRGALAGEVDRTEEVGASSVSGMRVPVRDHDGDAVAGDRIGERPDRTSGIGLHSVPQQNGGAR